MRGGAASGHTSASRPLSLGMDETPRAETDEFPSSILRAALSTKPSDRTVEEESSSTNDKSHSLSFINSKDENNGNTGHSQQWSTISNVFNDVIVSDVKFIESADVNLFSLAENNANSSSDSQLTTIILEPSGTDLLDAVSYASKENSPISVGRNEVVSSSSSNSVSKVVCSKIAIKPAMTKNVITKVHPPTVLGPSRPTRVRPAVQPYRIVRRLPNRISVVGGQRQVLKLQPSRTATVVGSNW